MVVWSLLLRLLLAAGLILNGSGYVVASVHMQLGQMEMADASQPSSASPDASAVPCDEHRQPATPALQADRAAAGSDTASMPSAGSPSDCCQADTCSCLCVHPACVVMPAVAIMAAMPARADILQAIDLDRPAPALQGVIRPPIG